LSVEVVYAFGNPNLGVYVAASEDFALVPVDAPEKLEQALKRNLGVGVLRASIGSSSLLGVFCVMNSKGILVGNAVREEEVARLREALGDKVVVRVLEEVKENALGNLILANDKGALVSPLLPKEAVQAVFDTLDVEVVQSKLGGSNLVGALGVATNRGVLLSPIVADEEVDFVISVLKTHKGGIGTVNKGNIFVRSGIVANSKGALVGFETTGVELMRIQAVLGP